MGVLTLSACGAVSALICDRFGAIVNLFNPNQTAIGIDHFLIRPPEFLTVGLFLTIIILLYIAAFIHVYPYNLFQSEFAYLESLLNGGPSGGRSKSKKSKKSRTRRDTHWFTNYQNCTQVHTKGNKEIELEHILIGLVSIDNEDCFMKKICQINQKRLTNEFILPQHETLLELLKKNGKKMMDKVYWTVYEGALSDNIQDCEEKYKSCK